MVEHMWQFLTNLPTGILYVSFFLIASADLYLFLIQRSALEIARIGSLDARTSRYMLPFWCILYWPVQVLKWLTLFLILSAAGWIPAMLCLLTPLVISSVVPIPHRHFIPMFRHSILSDILRGESHETAAYLLLLLGRAEEHLKIVRDTDSEPSMLESVKPAKKFPLNLMDPQPKNALELAKLLDYEPSKSLQEINKIIGRKGGEPKPALPEKATGPSALTESAADIPWPSVAALLYPISATIYASEMDGSSPALVAGYGLSNLGYLLLAAGIWAGSFRALGLKKRWQVFSAALAFFLIGTVLSNIEK